MPEEGEESLQKAMQEWTHKDKQTEEVGKSCLNPDSFHLLSSVPCEA